MLVDGIKPISQATFLELQTACCILLFFLFFAYQSNCSIS